MLVQTNATAFTKSNKIAWFLIITAVLPIATIPLNSCVIATEISWDSFSTELAVLPYSLGTPSIMPTLQFGIVDPIPAMDTSDGNKIIHAENVLTVIVIASHKKFPITNKIRPSFTKLSSVGINCPM
mmetsp:Transcript_9015/g.8041  ORF Transcript_9015/g.8041 Transcript_9015/m.8041 type:complete len:127 (+) Transcript_9015:137-517(+)